MPCKKVGEDIGEKNGHFGELKRARKLYSIPINFPAMAHAVQQYLIAFDVVADAVVTDA